MTATEAATVSTTEKTNPSEAFLQSDEFWLAIPFVQGGIRSAWLRHDIEIERESAQGVVITLPDAQRIVFIWQDDAAIRQEAFHATLVFDFVGSEVTASSFRHSQAYRAVYYPGGGRIRWVYPVDNPRPSFLHLYHQQTLRARIIAVLLRLWFLVARWKRPNFYVYGKEPVAPEVWKQDVEATGYCISLGVPGVSRSIITVYDDHEQAKGFAKYATGNVSQQQLETEMAALKKLQHEPAFFVPRIVKTEPCMMLTDSVKPKGGVPAPNLSHALIAVMASFYERQVVRKKVKHVLPLDLYRQDVVNWKHHGHAGMAAVATLYQQLVDSIDIEEEIPVAPSHGDFTPWNLYTRHESFYIFDWELFAENRPLFFDFIHFHVLQCIFTGSGNTTDIYRALTDLTGDPIIINQAADHRWSVEKALVFYLLIQSHFYLKNYAGLTQLTAREDIHLLGLQTLFIRVQQIQDQENQRADFFDALQEHLNARHEYALLKFFQRRLKDVSQYADIDMAIPRRAMDELKTFVEKQPFVDSIQTYRRSFKSIVKVYFVDGTFVLLDCIHRFQRKSQRYLPMRELLETRVQCGDLYLPAIYYDFSYYVIFQTLNGGRLKENVIERFYKRAVGGDEEALKNVIHFWKLNAAHRITPDTRQKVAHYVRNQNSLWRQTTFGVVYLRDLLRRFTIAPYPVITFSGPDGSGKSTFLEYALFLLEKQHRLRFIQRRHRPALLPILSTIKHGSSKKAESSAAARLPRQGKNAGLVSSFVRFCYYYVDYMIGQVWVLLRYRLWGYVVVYDRYYFDFINDARRSNIDLPRSFLKAGYRAVHKPLLNIFLYSTADEILKRKRELKYEEIEMLNEAYILLFNELGRRYGQAHYLVLRNHTVEVTRHKISQLFKVRLSRLS